MRYAREIWVQIVGQCEKSELTQEEFASQRGIPVATLRSWIYKLRREASESPPILPVRVVASTAPPAREGESGVAGIVVELADGVRLRFPLGTAGRVIAEVVGELRGRC